MATHRSTIGRAGIALLAVGLQGAAARAESVQARYGVTLAGLSIGVADLKADINGDGYQLTVSAKLTGLASAVTGGQGTAQSSGSFAQVRPVPKAYAVSSSNGKEARTIRMALTGGNVQAFDIQPPLPPDDKPDRIPVTEAHKRGIVDPVSALLMPVAAPLGDSLDPAGCNRTIPIFDGAARFDIQLAYKGTERIEVPGYSGPVLVCAARYLPIAGHRPERRMTKFMAENREIETWLAPVKGSRVLVPYRISVKTTVGTTVITAANLSIGGAGPRQPVRAGN